MQTLGSLVPLQAGGAQDPLGFLIPLSLVFLIFYVLVLRPQSKRQKEHEEMQRSLQKGDRIVSAGGLHGVVVGTADDVLTVDVGVHERVRVKLERGRVERRLEKAKPEETA